MKKFDIVNKLKIWLIIPAVILVIAFIFFVSFAGAAKDISKGLVVGLEFQGGSILTLELGNESNTKFDAHKKKVSEIISKNSRATVGFVQKGGSGATATMLFKYSINPQKDVSKTNEEIVDDVKKAYPKEVKKYGETFVTHNYIGPTASSRLVNAAVISVLVTTVVMLIYIIIRFELWSGIASVIGLIINVLVAFCAMIIFRVQINSTFIAALITIVSYSINNSIIVFDRIRENYKLLDYEKLGYEYIINISVRDTIVRSILATATTAIPVIFFAILSVEAVREFALPVIIGVLTGLFTSTCLAPALYGFFKGRAIEKHGRAAMPYKKIRVKRSKKEKK